jgi:hypothetical protein
MVASVLVNVVRLLECEVLEEYLYLLNSLETQPGSGCRVIHS